jgi:hypothetical protein
LTITEKPIPVGVVSNSYTLAQHHEVAEKCLAGIESIGVRTEELTCEVGLTELGEWMNLRFYFPDRFSFKPVDGHAIKLRLECTNSVDGSSRLVILLSWLRLICSNGIVVRESKTEIRDIHNERLNLDKIPDVVARAMALVENDIQRLHGWEEVAFSPARLGAWVNKELSERWGKKAACRVFHICTTGHDVEFADPFASGSATEKPVTELGPVLGSPQNARTLYDVGQAMSFVATSRVNTEERLNRQSQIPELIDSLRNTV